MYVLCFIRDCCVMKIYIVSRWQRVVLYVIDEIFLKSALDTIQLKVAIGDVLTFTVISYGIISGFTFTIDQTATSFQFITGFTSRDVVRLAKIFKSLAYDWTLS